jgi:hypothetical protein
MFGPGLRSRPGAFLLFERAYNLGPLFDRNPELEPGTRNL